ncbi:serine hydrolase domain-containing protein [Teichococcus cervicalis]|uniref:Beta-lactamase n=1 Tax=Pseudoroseomonas cervicalis ATCC 49957 TaxID=525371 RepID=D5RJL5_9PROT|nr:serine hydrolase [Pseudoroseomonas cervicalis]EFH12499.1 beta-lactamase [Pseudoroseomonas cervicalis ATCC 49957]
MREETSPQAETGIGDWPRWASPAAAGWDEGQLRLALRHATGLDTSALLLVVGGRVLLAEGQVAARYNVHSIRKSILSALIGMQVAEGRLDLDATLEQLGIDDRLGLTARERLATLLDLLCARSGVYHPSGYESPWMLSIKPARHSAGPGTTWCYNNWDFNALGSIFRERCGDIFAEFSTRLAGPLGMQDFDAARDGAYVELPESQHPAYPFRMSARDLARLGELFLRRGTWQGQRLLPEEWVRLSTLPISEAGHHGAYGYMWWVARQGILYPNVVVPEGSFAAHGTRGHKLLVMPALDAVLVHRTDTDQPNTSVSAAQFGRLLALLLRAAPRS